jgi:hypothetical protein
MAAIQGFTYPLTLVNGGLGLSSDFELIRQQIMSVLETRPYERIMRPNYGTPDLVFDVAADVALIVERTRIALETQIPDVAFAIAGNIADDGVCNLSIGWSLNDIAQPPIQYRLTD